MPVATRCLVAIRPMTQQPHTLPRSTRLQLRGCILVVGQPVGVGWMGDHLQLEVLRLDGKAGMQLSEAIVGNMTTLHLATQDSHAPVVIRDVEAPLGLEEAYQELRNFVRGVLRLNSEGASLGHGGLVLSGPEGVGKSHLVQTLMHALEPSADIAVLDIIDLVVSEGVQATQLARRFAQKRMLVLESLNFLSNDGSPSTEAAETTILQLIEALPPSVCILGLVRDASLLPSKIRSCRRLMGRLELPPPSHASREALLRAFLAQANWDRMVTPVGISWSDMWEGCLKQIALQTPGWVAGDLQRLCRAAQLRALQRRGIIDSGMTGSIHPEDLQAVLLEVAPASTLSVALQLPTAAWGDMIGYKQECKQVEQIMGAYFGDKATAALARLGVRSAPAGLFLYGPSGCGKTMLAHALAERFDANFIVLKVSDVLRPFLGETEAYIRQVFAHAKLVSPCVILFDEIDSLGVDRGRDEGADGGVGKRALGQLLNELDGVSERKGVFVIAASSHPEQVDAALTRPGRFEQHVYIGLPSQEDIVAMIVKKQATMPICPEVDINAVARYLTGATCATVDAVCREAAMAAFRLDPSGCAMIGVKAFAEAIDSSIGQQRPDAVELHQLNRYRVNVRQDRGS